MMRTLHGMIFSGLLLHALSLSGCDERPAATKLLGGDGNGRADGGADGGQQIPDGEDRDSDGGASTPENPDAPRLGVPRPAATYDDCGLFDPQKVYVVAGYGAGDDFFFAVFDLEQTEALCTFATHAPMLIHPRSGSALAQRAWYFSAGVVKTFPDPPQWSGGRWIVPAREGNTVEDPDPATQHQCNPGTAKAAFLRSDGSYAYVCRYTYYDPQQGTNVTRDHLEYENGTPPPGLPDHLSVLGIDLEDNVLMRSSDGFVLVDKIGAQRKVMSTCQEPTPVFPSSPSGFRWICDQQVDEIAADGSVTLVRDAPEDHFDFEEGPQVITAGDGSVYKITDGHSKIERCNPECSAVWDRAKQPMMLRRNPSRLYVAGGGGTLYYLFTGL